jgi:hypothetical protein
VRLVWIGSDPEIRQWGYAGPKLPFYGDIGLIIYYKIPGVSIDIIFS